MSKPTLFVCQSCHSTEHRPQDQPTDGTQLLYQLKTLDCNRLTVESVGCLWTCDKPCTAALTAPYKPTYLLTGIPQDSALALLELAEKYDYSSQGDIPWKQFPVELQTCAIAKIPPLS